MTQTSNSVGAFATAAEAAPVRTPSPELSAAPARLRGAMPDIGDFDEVRASRSDRVVWWVTAFVLAFLAWAWFFEIDEVSNGGGKVIP